MEKKWHKYGHVIIALIVGGAIGYMIKANMPATMPTPPAAATH